MPEAPAAPETPDLPEQPDTPVAFDAETMSVCVDSLAAQACFQYRSPADSPASLTVLLAIPTGPGVLDDIAALLPVDLDDPLPTSQPPVPVPMPTGLPGPPEPSATSSPSSSATSQGPEEEEQEEEEGSDPLPDPLASSTSASSSESPATSPHLEAEAEATTLSLEMGEQDSLVMTVRNDGTAADTVRLTAQTDAPIAFDTTDGSVHLAPGQQHEFVVRITPLAAGSGTLDLIATGEEAGTVLDSVLVAVQEPPSPQPQASIAASLDPTAIQSAVGQATAVTIRLANEGPVADLVSVKVSGQDLRAEPAQIQTLLQPGEAIARQVWITPLTEGASQIVMRITSDHGADLKPIVMMDAVGSSAPIDDDVPEDASGEDDSKDSPGFGLVAAGAAMAFALLARRKLRKT